MTAYIPTRFHGGPLDGRHARLAETPSTLYYRHFEPNQTMYMQGLPELLPGINTFELYAINERGDYQHQESLEQVTMTGGEFVIDDGSLSVEWLDMTLLENIRLFARRT